MTDFLISNIVHGLTGQRPPNMRFSGALRVRNGRIAEIGALTPEPGERVVDAHGCLVMPGLVNTHHHLFQSVLKGVPEGLGLPLEPWLAAVPFAWWPWIDEAALRVAARIGLAELALSGVTTVCDHHYVFSDSLDYDPAEVLCAEAARCGLRFVLARGGGTAARAFDEASLPPPPVETLTHFLDGVARTAARWHEPGDLAMTRVAVAPTTPTFNVAPGELAEIAELARASGLRLHSHLSETTAYAAFTLAHHGKRPVAWLAEAGWLGPDVWFAHLVDVDATEIAMLAESGTAMAHCPQANARLGSGIAPAVALDAAGAPVSLAVDGAAANEAADMAAALHAAFALQRARFGAAALSPEMALHWATAGGAAALGMPWTGTLAPGQAADIVLGRLDAPRAMGLHDPALAPVLCGSLPVHASFVGGRPLVVAGRLPDCDLATLADEARATVARVAAARTAQLR